MASIRFPRLLITLFMITAIIFHVSPSSESALAMDGPPQTGPVAQPPAEGDNLPPDGQVEPSPWQRQPAGEEKERIEELEKQIEGLLAEGDFQTALPLADEILSLRRRAQGKDHWQAVDAGRLVERLRSFSALLPDQRSALADSYAANGTLKELLNQGRYSDGIELARRQLAIRQEIFGETNLLTLDSKASLGRMLGEQGEYGEAETLFSDTLAGYRLLLGDDHPRTLTTMDNLGYVLKLRGKTKEAEPLYREALEGSRRVHGPDDPQTLTVTHHLGSLFSFMGRLDEAEPLYREALAGSRRAKGEDHPQTLTYTNNMAYLFDRMGKPDEAEPLYRLALEKRRAVLGPDHPGVMNVLNNLGALLNGMGRYREAEPLLEEALDGYYKTLGPEHPNTLSAMHNLVKTLKGEGRLTEAEPIMRDAVEASRRLRSDDHPQTLTLIHNLAGLLIDQARYAEAEPIYLEAIRGNRRRRGDEHLATLTTIGSLALLYQLQGRLAEAETLSRTTLELKRRTLGNDHQSTLITIDNLGILLRLRGELDEAESLFREGLDGRQRVLGDDHPQTLHSVNNLGTLLHLRESYEEAERLYLLALESYRRVLGPDHPRTMNALSNLGHLRCSQGRFDEAAAFHRQALEARVRMLGENHPDVVKSLGSLARVNAGRGDFKTAETMWIRSAEAFEFARLRASDQGLARSHFAAGLSPLAPLTGCLARNGKPHDAWMRLEQNLARGLLDTVSARESRPLTEEERKRETDLMARLNTLDERVSATSATGEEANPLVRSLREERDGLQVELAGFEAKMAASYGPAAGAVYKLSQIQRALPEKSAILAWLDVDEIPHSTVPGGEHWACVVREAGEPVWIRLTGSGAKEAWTSEDSDCTGALRRTLGQRPRKSAARRRAGLIEQVRRQRIDPVLPHLAGIEHLIVLPAGAMAGIAIEALTDGFTVSYAPSGTLFAWLREKGRRADRHRDSAAPLPLLALGDPHFADQPVGPLANPSETPDHGVLVAMVMPETNAQRNGILEGDVILSYAGWKLGGPADLAPAIQRALEGATRSAGGDQEQAPDEGEASMEEAEATAESDPAAGTMIPVTLWRDGKIVSSSVSPGKLGLRPDGKPMPDALLAKNRLDETLTVTRGPAFTPLPGSRKEVQAIATLFEPVEGEKGPVVLLGREASEQHLQALSESGELARFTMIHLATHGVMDDERAMRSALILSREEPPESVEQLAAGQGLFDGRLTGDQIARSWKLNAEMVTLSGCETALGKEAGGEGYLGFSQALFAAGARSLVLSLWKVSDQATMLLMKRFYENLLGKFEDSRTVAGRLYQPKEKMTRAAALREAKMWLRGLSRSELVELGTTERGAGTIIPGSDTVSERPFEDPYYWSAFILVGDPG